MITVDIMVNGRKCGEATINVTLPESLAKRHAITAMGVVNAAVAEHPMQYYCMGEVQLQRKR